MDISKVGSDRILDKNIQGANNADRAKKTSEDAKKSSSVKQSTAEKVKWSDDAKLMSEGLQAVKDAPDVRTDKIAALKAKIAAGTYKVDPDALAEKMLNDSLAEDLLTRKG